MDKRRRIQVLDTKHELKIITHYNFFQQADSKVSSLYEIPRDVLVYLLTIDNTTLSRPVLYSVAKRKLSSNGLAQRFGVRRQTLSTIRKFVNNK